MNEDLLASKIKDGPFKAQGGDSFCNEGLAWRDFALYVGNNIKSQTSKWDLYWILKN